MSLEVSSFYASGQGLPFAGRWATMPVRQARPLDVGEVDAQWRARLTRPITGNTRLAYVHIPFCATQCQFCGFYINREHDAAVARYADMLMEELALESASVLHQSTPLKAIFIGGGTPTVLTAGQLHRLISGLKQALPLTEDCEITVEGRILNFDDERIDACLEAGANRFSIGIQTFDTRLRRRLGRRADRDQAVAFIRGLAERDRAAVICDLMFGLPGQTLGIWREDLRIIADLPLDGVDLYALNLLPGTPLEKAASRGRTDIPSVAQARERYLQGATWLAEHDWRQLSNSHWARTSRERNLYNLNIKRGADYLAFGSGAGGNLAGQSFMVHRSLEKYYPMLAQGRKPLMMMTDVNEHYRWQMQLQGFIETGHGDLAELVADPSPLYPLLSQWRGRGLLSHEEGYFQLTDEGRFWASNLLHALRTLVGQLRQSRPGSL
ncbi:heme anaerobic degradation radical SAM methyltransferase ChuW/HutW [Martelella alba]|uniref:Heme anaerobic degradation radical SAM methyltransferase ChuW/HutW n=1 Tax=Martelella alba TaxID=2590451 RepID=A0ABY2SIH9_9HYPH|nr:heme anaerobic degradation radical SAM methyltransferase ChuW/HutW [Martelella alba]TKI05190.1 heme anaerobic degradation radical SAM methyltransferase ChuW/HutW [Martelella alba]